MRNEEMVHMETGMHSFLIEGRGLSQPELLNEAASDCSIRRICKLTVKTMHVRNSNRLVIAECLDGG